MSGSVVVVHIIGCRASDSGSLVVRVGEAGTNGLVDADPMLLSAVVYGNADNEHNQKTVKTLKEVVQLR